MSTDLFDPRVDSSCGPRTLQTPFLGPIPLHQVRRVRGAGPLAVGGPGCTGTGAVWTPGQAWNRSVHSLSCLPGRLHPDRTTPETRGGGATGYDRGTRPRSLRPLPRSTPAHLVSSVSPDLLAIRRSPVVTRLKVETGRDPVRTPFSTTRPP